ncbi:hypothetical protein ACWD4L_05670 [Streptomyces sp. NPDC002596]
MGEIELRHRRGSDMEACTDALATVHETDRYPAQWPADPRSRLTPRGLIDAWVAVDGPTVLGHVALTRTGEALARDIGLPTEQLVSVARLGAGAVAPVVGDHTWNFTASVPGNVPAAVAEFLPGRARWMHSAAYDRHLTGSVYAGRFFLDAVTDRLYFDTVNPTPQPDNS